MKKTLIILILCIFHAARGFSQTDSKPYVTSGLEMIFSFASIDDNGTNPNSVLRWAPVINIQSMLNKDLSQKFGLFTGLAVRNVGYIYDHYTDPLTENLYKKKFRSYNLAVPFGIKIGNLDKTFIYGGYELELPFLYKEKTFDAGGKIQTITGFFSSRENLFQHGFLVGVQFPYGINVKFKYYLSEFHNQNFVDGGGVKPYEGLKSNVFYISLSSYLFTNFHFETQSHYTGN
jgi:hypothetical protein